MTMLKFDSEKAKNFISLMEFFPYEREEKIILVSFIKKMAQLSKQNNGMIPKSIHVSSLSTQYEPALRGFLKYMHIIDPCIQFMGSETIIKF